MLINLINNQIFKNFLEQIKLFFKRPPKNFVKLLLNISRIIPFLVMPKLENTVDCVLVGVLVACCCCCKCLLSDFSFGLANVIAAGVDDFL